MRKMLLAVFLLLPTPLFAGPPERASGKMVLEGQKIPTVAGMLIIGQVQPLGSHLGASTRKSVPGA